MKSIRRSLLMTAVLALALTVVAWQSDGAAASGRAAAESAGRDLFLAKGCAACHSGPDSRSELGFPDLSDAGTWAGSRIDGVSAEGYLAESIRRPAAFAAPGYALGMPDLGLADDEITLLVDYLLGRD